MRIVKYLVGIWAVIAIYTFFSFLSGPKGIGAYNYLLAERERQWDNITNLGILYDELEKTRNNLLYDQDTLLIHARQLGYGQQDERFIRIVGLGYAKTVPVAAGSVYTAQNPEYVSDFNIKMVALCAGLLIFAFLFMLELIENRSR